MRRVAAAEEPASAQGASLASRVGRAGDDDDDDDDDEGDAAHDADAAAHDADAAAERTAGKRNPPRFKPRTRGALVDALPAEPEARRRRSG